MEKCNQRERDDPIFTAPLLSAFKKITMKKNYGSVKKTSDSDSPIKREVKDTNSIMQTIAGVAGNILEW